MSTHAHWCQHPKVGPNRSFYPLMPFFLAMFALSVDMVSSMSSTAKIPN